MNDTRQGLDLTQGRISTLLIKFAVPFMLANLVTSLYGVIGMLVVGRFTDRETIAGVAIGAQVMNLTYPFIYGIGTGGTVIIGRCIGERNKPGGTKAVGSFFIVSAVLITVLTLVILGFRELLLDALRMQADARPSASRYISISTIGIPFNIGYGMLSAVLRGMGNSRAPSIVAGISCAVNIALSFILVGAAGMAEAGVAIATVTAQVVSLILIALWLYIIKLPFPFSVKRMKPDGKSVRFITTVGLPMVLQELLISISFMVITNRVNTISVEAVAAVGIVSRVFIIGFVMPNSIGSAVSAMTAQNLGAGRHDRAFNSLRWGITYALIISALLFTFCAIWPETVTSVFSTDESVIKSAASYLRTFSFEAVLVSFVFNMNAYLSGYGKSKVAMFHTILSVICVRVPFSIIVTGLQGVRLDIRLTYLGVTGPMASAFSLIFCIAYIAWQRKQIRNGRLC